MDPVFQFDAFISYNRKDIEFAAQLEKALEKFTLPKGVHPDRRHLKVFRDTDDMTGTDYVKAIRRHLKASRKMIVVCSPNSRASDFVNEEVALFISQNPAESVIPILFRGVPNNEQGREEQYAFPPALVEAMGMPLGVDYRSWKQGSPNQRSFRNAWYSMLADVLEVTRDEIEERDRRRKAARNRTWGAITAGVLATTGLLAANWWTERTVREVVEQINVAQGQLQLAVNTRNTRARAGVLSGMAALPEVDGVLEAALSTGMEVSNGWFADLPGDYAMNTWEARSESMTVRDITPLAAAVHKDSECRFSLPGSDPVRGMVSADGSLEAYIHDEALFLQNADGFGPAMVTCLRISGHDNSRGAGGWREGTDTLEGRMGFGEYRGLPVFMVKDRGSVSLNVVRAFSPGKSLFAIGNVQEARFVDNETLEITIDAMAPQTIKLPTGSPAGTPVASRQCFSHDGDPLSINDFLIANGYGKYPVEEAAEPDRYDQIDACALNDGRVLAFATSSYGEFSNIGVVAALDLGTGEEIFRVWSHSDECTVFGRNTLSYCKVGDLSGENVTDQVGFWHFDEENSVHPVEDEKWSETMYGNAKVSPNAGVIALWGSAWEENPMDRSLVLWLEGQDQPRPFLLEESSSPVAQVEFSNDSRFMLVRRENGNLRLYSFETKALLKELGARVKSLQ